VQCEPFAVFPVQSHKQNCCIRKIYYFEYFYPKKILPEQNSFSLKQRSRQKSGYNCPLVIAFVIKTIPGEQLH